MKIAKIRNVKTPTRGTKLSAGIDFFIPDDFPETTLMPHDQIKIGSGIKVSVPKGYALIGYNKGGVAVQGLVLGACLVDEDFQGEIQIHLFNITNNLVVLKPKQKIVQFVLAPVFYDEIEVTSEENLYKEITERGEGGFGSTGK